MMKCGSCKDKHESVAEVRDCYAQAQHDEEQAKAEQAAEKRAEQWYEERGGAVDDPIERAKWAEEDMRFPRAQVRAYASEDDEPLDLVAALEASVREKKFIDQTEEERAARVLDGMTGRPGRDMASEAQVKYVMDLLDAHEWPDDITRPDVENMERRQVSKLIDAIKGSPKKRYVVPDVPEGRYCLAMGGDDAMSYSAVDRQDLIKFREPTLEFFQVDNYKGTQYLKKLIGAPGDYRKVPMRGMIAARVLTQIAKDPREASIRYGKESKVCGVCHSPLTNDNSLERGIGPVCAKKRGW